MPHASCYHKQSIMATDDPFHTHPQCPSTGEACLGLLAWIAAQLFPHWVTSMRRVYIFSSLVAAVLVFISSAIIVQLLKGPRVGIVFFASLLILFVELYIMQKFVSLATVQARNRIEAHADALKIFENGVEDRSILVRDDYDAYLPPNGMLGQKSKPCYKRALLFLPGALVSRVAYASVAKKLANKGLLVVVLNSETSNRLPSMALVERQVKKVLKDFNVEQWSIGGHSLGATTSKDLFREMTVFRKLVLWGIYAYFDMKILTDRPEAEFLVLQATNDGFRFANDKLRETWLKSINIQNSNDRVIVHQIAGGNHGGFASYDRHQRFPKPDGERSIPLDIQHDQVVRISWEFLIREMEEKKID